MIRFSSFLVAFVMISLLAGCSNQRYVSSETDDLYYSSTDRVAQNNNGFSKVNETRGEDYKSNEPEANEYFSVGKEQPADAANPNAYDAYRFQNQSDTSVAANGTTINNFYGTTNYYEGEYYDDSYATRLRRFNSTNLGLSYGYYDPFFVDPYWSFGWSYWDPFIYPTSGWRIGYSSWAGWNVGYSWGWGGGWGWGGNPRYWNRPYYGWGWNSWGAYGWGGNCYDPWGWGWGWNSPYYGWGGNYGWGFNNGYWTGYNNGYWNGFNDGFYTGGGGLLNDYNRRGTYNGRRDLVTDRGVANNVPGATSAGGTSGKVDMSFKEKDRVTVIDKDVTPTDNKAIANNSIDRFSSATSLYQVKDRGTGVSDLQNVKSESAAADRYTSNSKMTRDQAQPSSASSRIAAQDKYSASSLSRTGNIKNRYPAAPGTSATSSKMTSSSSQPIKSTGSSTGLKSSSTPSTSGTSRIKNSGTSSQPIKSTSSNARVQSPANSSSSGTSRIKGSGTTRTYPSNGSNSQKYTGSSRISSYPSSGEKIQSSNSRNTSTSGKMNRPSSTSGSGSNSRVYTAPSRNSGSSSGNTRYTAPSRSNNSYNSRGSGARVNSTPSRNTTTRPSSGSSRSRSNYSAPSGSSRSYNQSSGSSRVRSTPSRSSAPSRSYSPSSGSSRIKSSPSRSSAPSRSFSTPSRSSGSSRMTSPSRSSGSSSFKSSGSSSSRRR